jgi:hypothetical protein
MEALLQFARCSKDFREALRSCKTLPQACCDALEHGKTFSKMPLKSMRTYLAHLMADLALHADSRGWILDWGWLKVVVEIYRSAPFEEMRHFTGNALIAGLQTLILNSDTLRQLRDMDAVSILQPHNEKIDAARSRFWDDFCKAVLSGIEDNRTLSRCNKLALLRMTGDFDLPTLCSWDACSAGVEIDSGRKFKECAACGLVAYCR